MKACRFIIPVFLFLLLGLGRLSAKSKPSAPERCYGEMQTLANAETLVAVDTGFYVSLENLNDLSGLTTPDYNFIGDDGGTAVIDTGTARFQSSRRDLTVGTLVWKGPYVNFQGGRTDADDLWGYDPGTPLDLWGVPYWFYTPAGLVRPPLGVSLEDYGDRFDRYAIVSFGPDGELSGDDLVYEFGSSPTRLSLTSVQPAVAAREDLLTFKGYELGYAGGPKVPYLAGQPIESGVVSWKRTAIVLQVPTWAPLGEVEVEMRDGSYRTASFTIEIIERTGVGSWVLFE